MEKSNQKSKIATSLSFVAKSMLSSAANSRCMFCFHQPKQPRDLKKYRKF